MPHREDPHYLIEFVQMGSYVKVTAMDPQTGLEASIVGDPNAGEARLKQLAVKKLHYVMSKK
jgi:hypothetical protein